RRDHPGRAGRVNAPVAARRVENTGGITAPARRDAGAVAMSLRPPTLWLLSLREARRRPWRTLLTLLGVGLGVATFLALSAGARTTRDAYAAMFRAAAGRASLEVVADGRRPFASDLGALAATPDVAAAVPVVRQPSALILPDGPVAVLALAVDP